MRQIIRKIVEKINETKNEKESAKVRLLIVEGRLQNAFTEENHNAWWNAVQELQSLKNELYHLRTSLSHLLQLEGVDFNSFEPESATI